MDQENDAFVEDLNPRRLPRPAKFSQVPVKASVPDVSLIINHKSTNKEGLGRHINFSPTTRDCISEANYSCPSPQTYSSWKAKQLSFKTTQSSESTSNLTDNFPRAFGPRPYNECVSKSDVVRPTNLLSQTHVKFDHSQNYKQPFVRDTVISPKNLSSTTKYTKRNPLSQLQGTIEEERLPRSFKSNKFPLDEEELRKSPRDTTSEAFGYTAETKVIQKESEQILRGSSLSAQDPNVSSKNKCEVQQSATIESPRVPNVAKSYQKKGGIIHKKGSPPSQNSDQDCYDSHDQLSCSKKEHTCSITSANALIQAQNKVFEKTSGILDQMCTVNEKQCQMLDEILQRVSNLQTQQDSILVQLSQCPALTRNETLMLEKNNSSHTDKIYPSCQPLCIDEATQTCSSDYKTLSKHTVGVMTDPVQLNSETVQIPDEGIKFQSRHPEDPIVQKNLLVKNDGCNEVLSPNLAKAIKECQQMRSVLKQHQAESSMRRPEPHVDESLTLHGVDVQTVAEEQPSPLPSLHLDIQDYRESSDDDGDPQYESERGSKNFPVENVGPPTNDNMSSWTFYNNVVGQVNKFLESPAAVSQKDNGVPTNEEVQYGSGIMKQTPSIEAIRIATIEQFRKLGVSVYEGSTEIKEVSTTRRVKFDSVLWPGERELNSENSNLDSSMQMNDLALKYLKDDQLTELTKMSSGKKSIKVYNMGQKSTNMSLATQHYLERYKLLPPTVHPMDEIHSPTNPEWERNHLRLQTEGQGIHKTGKKSAQLPSRRSSLINQTDKILDITTLKRQPKLL